MCPGENEKYYKVFMSRDGTEARNLSYHHYCAETKEYAELKKHQTKIVYINNFMWFHVYNDTNTMREYILYWTLREVKNNPTIPYDWEILKIFFDNYNIEPYWISNDNGITGLIDEETGKWTGSLGKVCFIGYFKMP